MDSGICSTKFWDKELTWGNSAPLFTPCFIKLGLIWIPIAFFWVLAPFEVYASMKKDRGKTPWSALNVTKLIIVFLVMVLALIDIIIQMIRFTQTDVRPVEYYTPFLLFVTMAAVITVNLIQRKKGRLTSGLQFFFWFFMFLGTGGGFYTAMQKIFNKSFSYDPYFDKYQFSMLTLYFVLSFAMFILNCFADRKYKQHELPPRESPEKRASFFSVLTFWWFNPMAILGYKKPLTSEDMWDLNEEDRSEYLQAKFNKYWLPLVENVNRHHRRVRKSLSRRYSEMPSADNYEVCVRPEDYQREVSRLSVLGPILKTFGLELLLAGVLKFGASVITFVNPLVLDQLIAFVSSDDPYWKGMCFAAAMFLSAVIESFLSTAS